MCICEGKLHLYVAKPMERKKTKHMPLIFDFWQRYQWCGRTEPGQKQSEDGEWGTVQPRASWQTLPRLPLPAAGRAGPRAVRPLPHHQRWVSRKCSRFIDLLILWIYTLVLIIFNSYSTQFPHCHAVSNNEPLHQRGAAICILKHKLQKYVPVLFSPCYYVVKSIPRLLKTQWLSCWP